MESPNEIFNYTSRTENAKTSDHFQWFSYNNNWSLVTGELHRRAGLDQRPAPHATGRLFANPWRDYLHQKAVKESKHDKGVLFDKAMSRIVDGAKSKIRIIYEQEFSDLQGKIFNFKGFARSINSTENQKGTLKKESNYTVDNNFMGLFNNLYKTELDILIADTESVYVGEAKQESTFDASGDNNLVHQLVRQYVTVEIWLEYREIKKSIIPFIVGDITKLGSIKHNNQVEFMMTHKLLHETHVLSWEDIKDLRKSLQD